MLDDFMSKSNWRCTKMTICGGGLYGAVMNVTPNASKHWPPLNERTRIEYRDKLRLDECMEERIFDTWLTKCKHYSAEYYEED